MRRFERWRSLLALALVLVAIQQFAGAGIIKAKAWLAPVLIERAWDHSSASGGAPVRPWPWADTWPVARLQVPSTDVDLLVLAGDSGNALAFGPGHATASARPGEAGTVVIGGHRDTHFAFLRDLAPGAAIRLQSVSGYSRAYRVEEAAIVDASMHELTAVTAGDRLLLVTCYPFDALRAGGNLRYVVVASPAEFELHPNLLYTPQPEVYAL